MNPFKRPKQAEDGETTVIPAPLGTHDPGPESDPEEIRLRIEAPPVAPPAGEGEPGAPAASERLGQHLGEPLERTTDEAKMLLRFASTHGIEIPDEVARQICEADARSIAGQAADPDEETRFFAALRELSRLVDPVTVDSLIACDDHYAPVKIGRFTRRPHQRCEAKRAAERFMAITVGVLIVLLAIQSYWFVGQRILQRFEASTQALHAREFIASRANAGDQATAEELLTAGMPAISTEFSNLTEEELRDVSSGYGIALGQWSAWLEMLPQPDAPQASQVSSESAPAPVSPASGESAPESPDAAPAAAPPKEEGSSFDDDFEIVTEAPATAMDAIEPADSARSAGVNRTYRIMMVHSVLDVIQSLVLPLIYGLIGACAFVLRSLVTETRQHTYLPEKSGGYMLRLTLGLLAGLGVGYLFKDQISGDSALGAMSPLALAFGAGYSVELLFTMLDRFVPTSNGSDPTGPRWRG